MKAKNWEKKNCSYRLVPQTIVWRIPKRKNGKSFVFQGKQSGGRTCVILVSAREKVLPKEIREYYIEIRLKRISGKIILSLKDLNLGSDLTYKQ